MSVVFSGTNQGTFTQVTGDPAQIIQLRSDVDWMYVYNYTQAAASPATGVGCQYYWQRGMAAGTGIEWKKTNSSNAINMLTLTTGGFTLVNNTINTPGPAVAITAVSTDTPPLVSTASTAGLNVGSIVRLYNVAGAQQLGGIDFTVNNITANTSFSLAYGPTVAAGTSGNYRIIPYNPYFYPPTRVITYIGNGRVTTGTTVVTLSVTHTFTVGQRVRFIIPTATSAAYGMTQLNQVEATIVAINEIDANNFTNTITVDVNTSGFTVFAWPATTDPISTPAQVIPVGENMAAAIQFGTNQIGDSQINQGYIGISLAGGTNSPAGHALDVIYWVAGKSFNT